MKLLTQEILNKLPKLGATSNKKAEEVKVICKFFNPYGAGTWYITEGGQDGDDFIMFGYVCGLGFNELGYISLNELQSLRKFGKPLIERDLYYTPETLAEVMKREG